MGLLATNPEQRIVGVPSFGEIFGSVKKFIKDKEIADNKKTSGALISFSVENADEVKKFAQIAIENGGTFHEVDMGMPEEEMFSLEVQDLDGNTLEPVWMKM